jgi:hypothetical protein
MLVMEMLMDHLYIVALDLNMLCIKILQMEAPIGLGCILDSARNTYNPEFTSIIS